MEVHSTTIMALSREYTSAKAQQSFFFPSHSEIPTTKICKNCFLKDQKIHLRIAEICSVFFV